MLSFWEKKHFLEIDYIVVGSGISGLSTACSIKEKNPKARVAVLERGIFPTGASTKNAGFACIGSFTEKLSDLKLMGEQKFLKLVEDRWVGLYKLRKRLGDENIDYQNHGGFELILKNQQINTDELYDMNILLEQIFKNKTFHLKPELVKQFGFNDEMVSTVIMNPFEGQIDSGKMMKALYHYASILEVRIISGCDVEHIEETGDCAEVVVKNHATAESVTFKAQKVAVCTNAFTQKLLPDVEIKPGRGQVLCTAPVSNLPFKGVFSFDEGFYYFRNFENRIIFGGGRNLDFEKETTTSFELNEKIMSQLEFYLEEMIAPGQKITIEHRWAGIMAFGSDKLPFVQKVSDRIAAGVRLNGMGVALGSKIGEDLAQLLMT